MATDILRPNADVTNNWTKSTGTAGWACIDDVITQPTDAKASGDGASLSGTTSPGTTQECGFSTFTLGTDTVSKTTLYVYCEGNVKRGIDISLRTAAAQLGTTTSVAANEAAGWKTVEITTALTQSDIDDLRVRLVCTGSGGGASSPAAYAAYVAVDHAPAALDRYPTEIMKDSPILYWRLGESAGATTATDTSGNARTGTYSGPVLGQTGLISGDIDTCPSFDGVNDVVSRADEAALDLGNEFTLEAWAYSTLAATKQSVVGKNSVQDQYGINLLANGTIEGWIRDATSYRIATGGAWTTGQTLHLVLRKTTTQVILYVNGVEVGVGASGATTAPRDTASAFQVGITAAITPFQGRIDEVAVYSTALSPERIAAHAVAGGLISRRRFATIV